MIGAIHTLETTVSGLRNGVTCCDDCRRDNELRAADMLDVTEEKVGAAWAKYCEYLLHDDFSPSSMRAILELSRCAK